MRTPILVISLTLWGCTGKEGIHCWDLDADRTKDPNEDLNKDGIFDGKDCTGPVGPTGPQGPEGPTAFACVVEEGESIQTCVDTLKTEGGGTVLVRAGTYTLTQPIRITSNNITIRGEGPATILRTGNGMNAAAIFIGGKTKPAPTSEKVSRVAVSDLSIDGNKGSQTSATDADGFTADGILIRNAEDVSVHDVFIQNTRSAGISTLDGVRRFVASRTTIVGSFVNAVALHKTEFSIISESVFEDNSGPAILAEDTVNDNLISRNLILDNGHGENGSAKNHGIWLADANRNLFTNNQIEESRGTGVVITNSGPLCSQNNYFEGNVLANNTEYAVWIQGSECRGNNGHGNCWLGNGIAPVLEVMPGMFTETDGRCASPP